MPKKAALVSLDWVDSETGIRGYLIIDRLVKGVCGGGCRIRPGLDRAEVTHLARTMTYKWALLGIPMGGAKSGIDMDPGSTQRRPVLERFLRIIKPYVQECYLTGDDMGSDDREIKAILQAMGISTPRYAYLRKTGRLNPETLKKLEQAESLEWENERFAEIATGYGVYVATCEALATLDWKIEGTRFAVQGFGKVGGSIAEFLWRNGGKVLAVSDGLGGIYRQAGLNIGQLLSHRLPHGIVDRSKVDEVGGVGIEKESVLTLDVDCLILAAVPGAISSKNVHGIQARLIVEGANNPIEPEAERILNLKGTVIVPGIVANAAAAGFDDFALACPQKQVDIDWLCHRIAEQIGGTTRAVLKESLVTAALPSEIARQIAEKQLRQWDRLD